MKKFPGVSSVALVLALGGCAAPSPHEALRSDELFQAIRVGMQQEDVRRLLGPPDDSMPFSHSNTVAWDYRYMDTWGYFAVFSVTFDAAGRAVGRISWRTNDGGDHQ